MAFVDPILFVISGVTKTLARVRTRDMAADYQDAELTTFQTLSHQNGPIPQGERGRYIKSLVGTKIRKILDPETQEFKTLSVQVSVLRPETGFTKEELRALWTGMKTQMNDAFIDKVYGQES